MKVYYDLSVSPPTYDAVAAACRFELERLRAGADSISVTILTGFRRDTLWPFSEEERNSILRQVAMPIFMLLPAAGAVTLESERPKTGLGVRQRMYGLDQQVIASREGVRPLRFGRKKISNPRRITMTLRECIHWPGRNSNVDEWAAAARILASQGYEVIVVRDTLRADEPLGDLQTFPAASRKLFARADLYESAALNLFIANGPAMLSLAMDVPTLIFKRPRDEELGRAFGRQHFNACGFPWGGQMPGAPAYQRMVWQDDTALNIVSAVDDFMAGSALAEAS